MRYVQKQTSCQDFNPSITKEDPYYSTPSKDEKSYQVKCEARFDDDKLYPPILTTEMMNAIASNGLPLRYKFGRWTRLYNSHRDGTSLSTFLHNTADQSPTVFVVRTTRGEIIGGFAERSWRVRPGFFGTGNSFLFSVNVDHPLESSVEQAEGRDAGEELSMLDFVSSQLLCMCFQDGYDICRFTDIGLEPPRPRGQNVKIFNWTGKNDYFQLCQWSDRRIAFGGGGSEANFGLCVEGDFSQGSSGSCETFGNEQLTEEKVFEIDCVEVFGISSCIC